MDDVDDDAVDLLSEERVASMSTDKLREEVARLQSLLVAPDDEERANDVLDLEDIPEQLQTLPESRSFSWIEDTTLKYTNGDVYKVCEAVRYFVDLINER